MERNLTKERIIYKPFEYPEAFDYWMKQHQAHWIHSEVPMMSDINDWKQNLSETEKNIIGSILKGFAQCYDEKTEILTDSGWKLFKDLSKDDKVAQYDKGEIQFVLPSNYHVSPWVGNMHSYKDRWNRINLLVTPNHRMVYLWDKKEHRIEPSENIKWTRRKDIPLGGYKKGNLNKVSYLDKLKIAYQADGQSLRYNKNSEGLISNYIEVGKPNKIKFLEEILSNLDFKYSYTETENIHGTTMRKYKILTPFELPKNFDWVNIQDVSTEWCLEFMEELSKWDSHIDEYGKIIYSNSCEKSIDVVQIISTFTNKWCTRGLYEYENPNHKPTYVIRYQPNQEALINGQALSKSITEEEYSGLIYCVTVPSGTLVIRREGVVSISGNTETVVNDYWTGLVTKWFRKPEIIAMATTFGAMETIHAEAYSLLNETLGLDDFSEFLEDEATMAKIENLMSVRDSFNSEKNWHEIAKSLAIFSAFTEGVNLFSSFAVLLSFKMRNRLKGVGQIVEWSIRDESMHSEAGCWLFRTLIKENPELKNQELQTAINEAALLSLKLELDFIDKVYELGDLEGCSKYDLQNFIKNRVNTKLGDLGYDPIISDIDFAAVDRMKWFDHLSAGKQHSDFFSTRVTNYSKGVHNWDATNIF